MPHVATDDPEIAVDAEFGRRIQEARRARGWSQTDLARAIVPRVSQATISAIEKGEGASSSVLAICRVLRIEPPVVGLTPELARWLAVGRVLALHPRVLEYHLAGLEAVAAALKDTASP